MKEERENGRRARLHKRRVYKLGTEQRYRTIDKTTVKTRKSRATMRVRGKRVGKFMEHVGSYQSWRFIGLIVTRAKRRRRRCTRSKTSPPTVKIFSPEKRSEAHKQKSWNEKEMVPSKTEMSMLRSRRRKVDRREFVDMRFMDYRSSVRDLSSKPNAELSRRSFRQERNCTLDENTLDVRKAEKNRNTFRLT